MFCLYSFFGPFAATLAQSGNMLSFGEAPARIEDMTGFRSRCRQKGDNNGDGLARRMRRAGACRLTLSRISLIEQSTSPKDANPMTEPKKADDAKATTARVGKNAEYPQLIVSQWVRGEPLGYECSLCAQVFTLSEDLDPKESAARLIAEFQNHLEKMHPEKR